MSKPTNKGPYRIPNKEQYHEILELMIEYKNYKYRNPPREINDKLEAFADMYWAWYNNSRATVDKWNADIDFVKRWTES